MDATNPDRSSREPVTAGEPVSRPQPEASVTSRPHWSARAEDAVYVRMNSLLQRRGWVPRVEPYTGYGAPGWVRVMARAVLAAPGTTTRQAGERDAASAERAIRGWRSFLTAQLPSAEVTIRAGDRVHRVTADRGGYVDAVVEADLPVGWQEVQVQVGSSTATAPVLVIDPATPYGVVSDIDDTVMVTALPRPMLAAWNAFVLHESARRVVPGMAGLYRRWHAANPGSPTFYLSTGAWNAAPALRRFLQRNGYPAGPLLLTDWGPTNSGLFRSGQQHKHQQLRRLLAEFPGMRWVLVGDDGQHDPEIYGELAAEHPDRVHVVAIRQLSVAEQVLAHGTTEAKEEVPRTPGGPVTLTAPDGNALALSMIDAGLLGR